VGQVPMINAVSLVSLCVLRTQLPRVRGDLRGVEMRNEINIIKGMRKQDLEAAEIGDEMDTTWMWKT
jgi:hypothetical protein